MNVFTKKKMLSIIADLLDGIKSLKQEQEDVLSDVWLQNLDFFTLLINMLGDHLKICDDDYEIIIECIEQFCQAVEQVKQDTEPSKSKRNTSCKEMKKLLEKCQFEIKKRVAEDKKELLFLPYNYTMWDSLESIWKAAKDSGEFEVVVVPIPFFDKYPDGSFGKMHYHGAEYPPEVEILDWQSYDIADRQPDVVYIHNPYDELNYVTTVHPNFYCDQLKKHCGSLVYVPYFVGTNDTVAEHFHLAPGVLKADKVIVQSENVRQEYIKTLLALAKESNLKWSKTSLEKKIIGLGSPKYDKARQDGSHYEVPESWKPVFYRADGTKKKVIFFNCTIFTVLNFGEEALDKIEDALRCFQENQEQIALLWRPHPLLEETFQSMRPSLRQRYQQITQKYCQEAWGVFDKSQDFSRAVALSDGYYGDVSSVVDVFEKGEKPVMIRNLEILYHSEYVKREEM